MMDCKNIHEIRNLIKHQKKCNNKYDYSSKCKTFRLQMANYACADKQMG